MVVGRSGRTATVHDLVIDPRECRRLPHCDWRGIAAATDDLDQNSLGKAGTRPGDMTSERSPPVGGSLCDSCVVKEG
jgi:hypothetical protein